MANTDALLAVDLSPRHVKDAMELVHEAGWNQTVDDWRMMLSAGAGFGYQDGNGRLVASAMALPYGTRLGWIGMVLVTAAHQRRGLATRLIDRAIRWFEAAGLTPALDATPAGEQVYLKRGFKAGFSYHRWQHPGAGTETGDASAPTLNDSDIQTVQRLDRAAFGADRGVLIETVARRGAPCLLDDGGHAFALCRAGRVAHQIGPIVARDEQQAIALFKRMKSSLNMPVFVDIPDLHTGLTDHLKAAGFTRQRPFRRMVLGDLTLTGPNAMFALFGPELG